MPYPLVDIHCHLEFPQYDEDRDAVLTRALDAGVRLIVTQGVHLASDKQALELARKHGPLVKAALGIYPLNAPNVTVKSEDDDDHDRSQWGVDETLAFIREHAHEMVAIGEVGMDLFFSDDRERQAENFRKVIALAKEIGKPLIIHSRKAEKDVLNLLEEAGIDKRLVIMHCFSGNKKLIARAARLGYSFSIPCNIVRSQHFQMLVGMVPLSQLLTETDGPYIPPDCATWSEPAHIAGTVQKIAELKGMTVEETANGIYLNAQRLFRGHLSASGRTGPARSA